MSSLIHYKYKIQEDRGSIKKIYNHIQKNLYHNFIKLQERQHIKNLYEYKFNIIIKKENKYIFEDETKPYSTILLIPSEGQTEIKETIKYLKDKHKFIDLYYKNKDKYYNYIRIIPKKIIDDTKIEFKIQDNQDFPKLQINNSNLVIDSDTYNNLSKDYEDSSGVKWNILTYNENGSNKNLDLYITNFNIDEKVQEFDDSTTKHKKLFLDMLDLNRYKLTDLIPYEDRTVYQKYIRFNEIKNISEADRTPEQTADFNNLKADLLKSLAEIKQKNQQAQKDEFSRRTLNQQNNINIETQIGIPTFNNDKIVLNWINKNDIKNQNKKDLFVSFKKYPPPPPPANSLQANVNGQSIEEVIQELNSNINIDSNLSDSEKTAIKDKLATMLNVPISDIELDFSTTTFGGTRSYKDFYGGNIRTKITVKAIKKIRNNEINDNYKSNEKINLFKQNIDNLDSKLRTNLLSSGINIASIQISNLVIKDSIIQKSAQQKSAEQSGVDKNQTAPQQKQQLKARRVPKGTRITCS